MGNGKMKNILLAIFMVVIFQGCISEKRCNRRYPPQVTKTDSVYVNQKETITETIRDTVIKIAPDSSSIEMLILCDSTNQAYLSQILNYESGKQAGVPQVVIKDRILTVKCRVDSMAVYATLKDRFTENLTTSVKNSETNQTINTVTNELTWFQNVMINLGWILLAVIVIAVAILNKGIKDIIKNIFK